MAKKAAGAGPADGKPAKGKKAKPIKAGAPAAKVVRAAKVAKTAAPVANAKSRKGSGQKSATAASAMALTTAAADSGGTDKLFVDEGVLRVCPATGSGSAVWQSWLATEGHPAYPSIDEYVALARDQLPPDTEGDSPLFLNLQIPVITDPLATDQCLRDTTIKALLLLFVYLSKSAVGIIQTSASKCCRPDQSE